MAATFMPAGVDEDLWGSIADDLTEVEAVFDAQLDSDLPPVSQLVRHVERYRGKMLRPILVLTCGRAAAATNAVGDEHTTLAAVCEMVHMATLVHDDVLDEAEVRRRGRTLNSLRGNEAAVILGDYLIAGAFHLCSSLDSQRASRLVGEVAMTLCAGELLQLHHRDDLSLDEATYFEIIDRKTASLIGLACRLGAEASGAEATVAGALETYGRLLGRAFQIQDDLLDLTGRESVVGKSLGKDLEKGKLTLPLIHHLATCEAEERGVTLSLLAPDEDGGVLEDSLRTRLAQTDSIAHAENVARQCVAEALDQLSHLKTSPARDLLETMGRAVVERDF